MWLPQQTRSWRSLIPRKLEIEFFWGIRECVCSSTLSTWSPWLYLQIHHPRRARAIHSGLFAKGEEEVCRSYRGGVMLL